MAGEETIVTAAPTLIGLVGVAVAILERGWKAFKDEQKTDPELRFNGAYLLNLIVSAGWGTAMIAALPMILQQINDQTTAILTVTGGVLLFVLGYLATYRVLDGLNNTTDKKVEIAQLKKENTDLKTSNGTETTKNINRTTAPI